MSESVRRRSALFWKSVAPLQANKPTIIFIHASWMSSEMWDETVHHMASSGLEMNLVQVDLNGHGRTTQGRELFSLWDQAEDVLHLLDELNIQSVLAVGMSMGAMVVLRMALLGPSRVNGLVLLGSSVSEPSEASKLAFEHVRNIWVSTPTPSDDIMNIAIQGWGGSPDVNSARAARIKKFWVERHSGAENIDPILNCMNAREDITGRLSEIHVPVLLIHGEKDETYPLQDAKTIRDQLIGSEDVQLVVIDGAGHLVIHMRESSDVAHLISKFAAKIFPS